MPHGCYLYVQSSAAPFVFIQGENPTLTAASNKDDSNKILLFWLQREHRGPSSFIVVFCLLNSTEMHGTPEGYLRVHPLCLKYMLQREMY